MSPSWTLAKGIPALAILIVLAVITNEIRCFRLGRRRITRGQMRLRVIAAALMVVVLGMWFAGSFVLPDRDDAALLSRHDKAVVLSYWSLCIGLTFVLIVLALADVRVCLQTYRSQIDDICVGVPEDQEHRN